MEIDKKTLNLLLIGGGSLVGIIILIIVLVNLFSKSYKSYEEVETLLKNAAIEFYKTNNNLLPTEDGEELSISETPLVKAGLVQPLEELLKNGEKCTANIIIEKNIEGYNYSAYLNCGDDYNSVELYKVITDNKNIVTTGNGLYEKDNEYIFRGEANNNYISFSDKIWRILKVSENKNVVLINTSFNERSVWDDRYNVEFDSFDGINDFNISRIKDNLISLFEGTEIIGEAYKNNIISKQWCIGKRSNSNTLQDGNIDCNTLSNDSLHLGLITPYEFLQISLDENCNDVNDYSCLNYNYLNELTSDYWTLNASSENSRDAFTIGTSSIKSTRTAYEKKLPIVVYLDSKVMFKSGEGTLDSPYIIR